MLNDVINGASIALLPISGRGISVRDGWYDPDITDTHITLWLLNYAEDDHSDDDSESETATVQVNIWSLVNEVALADEVLTLMKAYGFDFLEANDAYEDDTELYVKQLRFSLTVEKNNAVNQTEKG